MERGVPQSLYIEAIVGLGLLGLFYAWRARVEHRKTDASCSTPSSPVVKEDSEINQHGTNSIYHRNKSQGTPSTPFPLPEPLLDFSLETARTRDYIYVNKTLRYPYYQTMAHQPLAPNDWIELSASYRWYLAEKKRVIEEQGKKVIDSLPENDTACGELLELVVEFMTTRYPTLFDRLIETTQSGKELDGIFNHVTGERYQWVKGCPPEGVEGLMIISRLTENDFLMARERDDGHVYFVGGLVAFPGFYLLSEKIDKSMYDVHLPVPQFNQKLLVSVERTLKRMDPNAPFERSSWGIADDNNLFYHNLSLLPKGGKCTTDPGDLYLRIDRRELLDYQEIPGDFDRNLTYVEAFRKLPRSKVITFAVHPLIKKMRDIKEDSPLVPALLAKIYDESSKDMLEYKEISAYYDELKPWLEEATKDQISRGLIKGDEAPQNFRDIDRPVELLVPPVAVP